MPTLDPGQAVRVLERDWPSWMFWTVDRAVSKPRTLFCARRWDDEKYVLNAGSAAELVELLEAEAEK